MECKALMKRMFFFLFMPDLIETLWNVKSFVFLKIFRKLLDLIETLWNVKDDWPPVTSRDHKDLIETLWNVKYHPC